MGTYINMLNKLYVAVSSNLLFFGSERQKRNLGSAKAGSGRYFIGLLAERGKKGGHDFCHGNHRHEKLLKKIPKAQIIPHRHASEAIYLLCIQRAVQQTPLISAVAQRILANLYREISLEQLGLSCKFNRLSFMRWAWCVGHLNPKLWWVPGCCSSGRNLWPKMTTTVRWPFKLIPVKCAKFPTIKISESNTNNN